METTTHAQRVNAEIEKRLNADPKMRYEKVVADTLIIIAIQLAGIRDELVTLNHVISVIRSTPVDSPLLKNL